MKAIEDPGKIMVTPTIQTETTITSNTEKM